MSIKRQLDMQRILDFDLETAEAKLSSFDPKNEKSILPDDIKEIELPTNVNLANKHKTFVTNKDNKAFIIPIDLSSRNEINSWVKNNMDLFNQVLTGRGEKGDLPAINLDSAESPLNKDKPEEHPLLKNILSILQIISNQTGCTIETLVANNNFLTNYYSQRGIADLKNSNLAPTFFGAKDNTIAGLHIDNKKADGHFNFTVAVYTCNKVYSQLDKKRLLFPKENYSDQKKDEAVYIDIHYDKPFIIVFPSYALHGTEEWDIKKQNDAAKKIQGAYKVFLQNKQKNKSTPSKEMSHLINNEMKILFEKPISHLLQKIEDKINLLANAITIQSKNKLLAEYKAEFNATALELWQQENKVKLKKECIAWIKTNEPGKKELIEPLENSLKEDQKQVSLLLEANSLPFRISIVWRGSAYKSGLNCEQIAELFRKALMQLKPKSGLNK